MAVDGALVDVAVPDAPGELVLAEDPQWVAGELDQQLELQAADMHDVAGDRHRACGLVDVDLADVQLAAGDLSSARRMIAVRTARSSR